MLPITLNQRCIVTLTREGATAWNGHHASAPRYFKHRAGDSIETVLWELMEIMGPHLHMGMDYQIIQDNKIDLLDIEQKGKP